MLNALKMILRAPISTCFVFSIALALDYGKYQKALNLLTSWERKAEERSIILPPAYRALRGELLIRTDQQHGVKEFYDGILAEISGLDDDKTSFIRHYSKYWLSLLRVNYSQARYHAIEGNKVSDSVGFLELPTYEDEEFFEPDDFLTEAAKEARMSVEEFFDQQKLK